MSREFDLKSLIDVWDYLLSGFKPEIQGLNSNFDHLYLLDFICLALIRHSRQKYMEGDYTECLITAMKPLDLTVSDGIIESAELYRR